MERYLFLDKYNLQTSQSKQSTVEKVLFVAESFMKAKGAFGSENWIEGWTLLHELGLEFTR